VIDAPDLNAPVDATSRRRGPPADADAIVLGSIRLDGPYEAEP